MAARDRTRAEAFANRHSIPRVYGSYRELVEAPDLEAVYVPLPNGLHAEWTLAALAAGKHVLCEKPFAANATEAERVADAAAQSGLVVMEAFHWRYHPLATRLLEIVGRGDLGEIERIEAALIFPLLKASDIRWQLDLAGGSLMDAGCYPVHLVRTLAGAEPVVTSAVCKERSPGVDRWIRAELEFQRWPLRSRHRRNVVLIGPAGPCPGDRPEGRHDAFSTRWPLSSSASSRSAAPAAPG